MARLADAYPYLVVSATLLLTVIAAARATLGPSGLRGVLRSGGVGLPAGLLAPFFEAAYWRPVRLGGGPVGIEDALFGFASAAWVWYLVVLRFPALAELRPGSTASLATTLASAAATCALFVTAWRSGLDPMTAALATCMTMTFVLLAFRRASPAVAAWGAASFAAAYALVVATAFAVVPAFAAQWSAPGPWGVHVAGVPIGEIAWAGAFGAFWPCFVLHALRAPSTAGPRGLDAPVPADDRATSTARTDLASSR